MRRIAREPLSEQAMALLCRRSFQIAAQGHQHTRIADRMKARSAEAERLWDQEKTKAFDEIRQTLSTMAPGNEFCMYCESGEGSDIEHFWPKKQYPGRAYAWENYLWACSICNSNYKRTQFPLDEHGKPLLINPVDEDPREHLALDPRSGKYLDLTPKGENSIQVFGLNRTKLEKGRLDAWYSVQAHIVSYARAYASGDNDVARDMQRTLCRHPHASILIALLDRLNEPSIVGRIHPDCRAAIEACPEIKSWV